MTEQPEKVDLSTPDLAAANREALAALFPGVLADGVLDATRLGELLDVPVAAAADGRERFGLMWAGKQEAVRSLLTPSRGTLIPDLERSVDFDNAKNVFIEGDNLEVLKLLQKAYNDKVKLIYIDPPYNTGNDFIYEDDFSDGLQGYLESTGQIAKDGTRLSAQVEVEGRLHSRWLSMMYPRLMLARNLLSQDGAIFVSVDFNEVASLRLLMDQVFGSDNFQREIIWRIGWLSGYKTAANNFIRNHDTMLFYSRSSEDIGFIKRYLENQDFKPVVKRSKEVTTFLAELGLDKVSQDRLLNFLNHENRPTRYPIEDTWNSNEYDDLNSIAIVSFSGEKISKLLEVDEEYKGQKSVKMLRRVIESITSDDDVVLDFFAGSGSTAHAVMEANQTDGGSRRCISVNYPEPLDEAGASAAAGYRTVCDLGIARIKKVMSTIDKAAGQGLRIFSLSPSHFQTHRDEGQLDLTTSTLLSKESDWHSITAEILLAEGLTLDAVWERVTIDGALAVRAEGVLVLPRPDLSDVLLHAAMALEPRVIVCLEDGFAGKDTLKANAFTKARQLGITLKTV